MTAFIFVILLACLAAVIGMMMSRLARSRRPPTKPTPAPPCSVPSEKDQREKQEEVSVADAKETNALAELSLDGRSDLYLSADLPEPIVSRASLIQSMGECLKPDHHQKGSFFHQSSPLL